MAATELTLSRCLALALLWLLLSYGHSFEMECIEVKRAYIEKGFGETDVPIRAIPGDNLEICPQGHTCCTTSMESKLKSLAIKEHSKEMMRAYKIIHTTFSSRTRKFDEFFTELLENSRRKLHEMFVNAYGLTYMQNSEIFAELFTDLRGYYKGADKNLLEVMDNFFSRLLQRMVELLNMQYEFDDAYLGCVTERMNDLKPFGEVPQKLSIQVKRAFIAARTFVQGLAIGRDVVTNVMEIVPTESCTKALMRMMYCPHCRGLVRTKPCNNYCLNTMKGCLADQAELNNAWNAYIEALKMLANRLEGPFNIEAVVQPIDVMISEAIMNLQQNSDQVTNKIIAGCGTPPARIRNKPREKREAQPEPSGEAAGSQEGGGGKEGRKHRRKGRTDVYDFDMGKRNQDHGRYITAAGTSLDRLVRDIKERVKVAKDFWVQLPYNLCNNDDLIATPESDSDCWNGQDRARYKPEVQKDGVLSQINNPEVEVDVTKANAVVNRQIIQLKLITSRLHNAYKGQDVDWMDIEDDYISGSGSGMGGSGSSEGPIPVDNENGIVNIDNPPYITPDGGKKDQGTNTRPQPPIPGKPERPRGSGTTLYPGTSLLALLVLVVAGQHALRVVLC